MNRRELLTATTLMLAAEGTPSFAAQRGGNGQPDYYEIRRYSLKDGDPFRRLEAFYSEVAVPALNRAGAKPVGLFTELEETDSPSLYALLSFRSLAEWERMPSRLEKDEAYQKAGADFLGLPSSDPPYLRYESEFLAAFEGFPHVQAPASAKGNAPRIFELRTYESHSERAHLKKVEMFNRGEIAIFQRTGLTPVFFSRALVGSHMPHLTYMLTFKDRDERDKSWRAFGGDPEWRKLSQTPGYTDKEIVSKISDTFLKPLEASQI